MEYSEGGTLLYKRANRIKERLHFDNSYKYTDGKLTEDSLIYYIKNQKRSIITYYAYYADSSEQYEFDSTGFKNIRTVFTYDEKSNVAQRKLYRYDKLLTDKVFKYDPFNNIELCKVYLGDVLDDIYNYDYEYDEHQNFVKRTEYKNKRIYSITTRRIEYQ
jgi:hypothetical protein